MAGWMDHKKGARMSRRDIFIILRTILGREMRGKLGAIETRFELAFELTIDKF